MVECLYTISGQFYLLFCLLSSFTLLSVLFVVVGPLYDLWELILYYVQFIILLVRRDPLSP